MKRHLITPLIVRAMMVLALVACASSAASAQEYRNTPVEISKEKVRIGGQVCYSHVVLERQTLFSICKAYNVSEEDIYKYNPSVREHGLKKNSILIIPIIEQPVQEVAPEPEKPVSSPKRKTHTVKWYEDLDAIASRYGITSAEIMKANDLKSKKLARRQKLIIPFPGEYPAEQQEFAVTPQETYTETDTVAIAETIASDEHAGIFSGLLFPKKEVSMSLLLPLKATGSTASRQNMDFYSGMLLAVYDMAKEGISTNLNVYDVAEGVIPDRRDIMESDIIIGPVASGDINRTFAAAPGIGALVSPLDPRAENIAYTQKGMIHAPTPHSVQYRDLAAWIKEELKPEDRVLVITEKGARQTDATTSMKAAIDSSRIDYKPLSYSILEGRNITETLAWLMTETGTNRVYIASESEAFVNDVVRNLNVMIHQKYDVVLYAPSKIRSFETIEVENFHNTKMRVSTGYYIDYNDPKVMEFLLRYRALYNTEPTQFAYQGYDLAKYFIGLCSRYGSRWTDKLESNHEDMLQSTFDFTETPNGGYINNAVRRIVYGENWSVETIR